MREMDFTLPGYAALLERFEARGYAVVDFEAAVPDARHLILRHDIDLSVEAALPMAELEADRSIRASYFVQLRSPLYNAFASPALDALKRMADMDHTIGLHFDAAVYAGEHPDLDRAAARECEALEALLERPVRMISFHRPAPALRGGDGPIAGRSHAYEARFFETIGYCSDSRGAWRHGHPLDHPAVVAGHALQLLTHPLWWTAPVGSSADRLDRWLDARLATLDEELAANIGVHRAGRCAIAWSNS